MATKVKKSPAKKQVAKKPSGKPVTKPKPVVKTKKQKDHEARELVQLQLDVNTGDVTTKTRKAKPSSQPHWEQPPVEAQFQGPAPETLSPEAKTDLLIRWSQLRDVVATYKPTIEEERMVRAQAHKAFFQNPSEGTSYQDLAAGYRLKTVYQIERDLDKPAMDAVIPKLVPAGDFADYNQFAQAHAQLIANLIRWEPKLNLETYRQLSVENKALLDQCIIMKPKSVSLEIVAPAEQTA